MTELLNIGICDDQQACLDTLSSLLKSYLQKKQLHAQITAFNSAEELLNSDWQSFEIIFLDVVMEKQDGVQAAKQIRRENPDVSLIFVSSFLDYATMGYQVKASAYLLKNQLASTLGSAMDSVLVERNLNRDAIDITVDGQTVTLPLHEICYIESQGRTAVFNGNTQCRTYMRFSELEWILSEKGFFRVHRCYIVNPEHCLTMKNYQVLLDNGRTLPCSRQNYTELVRKLMRWKGLHT